jgi:hypothetical protein
MRIGILLLLVGLLVACAPKSVPIPEESINECQRLTRMTERLYLDKNPEEILAAAARIFQLADGDYIITRSSDGLTARRAWSPLAPGNGASRDGADTWQLTAKNVTLCVGGSTVGVLEAVESDPHREIRGRMNRCGETVNGIKLTAYHIPDVYSQSLIPSECFSSPAFMPAVSRFTTTPAVYDLFFLRMDYLLGQNSQWPSCASYSEYIRNNVHYRDQFSMLNFQGHLDGLCVQVQDSFP